MRHGNAVIARQNFSAHPNYFYFSKFSYRQNMFERRNLSSNMPKSTLFSMKNCKNRPALGAISRSPMPPADEG